MTISTNEPSAQLGAALLASVIALGACSIDPRDLTTAAPDSLLPSSEGGGAGDRSDAGVRMGTAVRGDAGVRTGAGLESTGAGVAPAALQAPDALDFGGVPLQGSGVRTLAIENAGGQATGAITTRIAGPAAADFTVQQNACLGGISAQASCSVPLAFAPSAAGARLATLTLTGMAGGTRSVALSGQGLEPGPITLEPAAVGGGNFGISTLGSSSQPPPQTFLVSNPGATASGILSISSVGAGFQILNRTGNDCVSNATNLQPQSSCTVRVAFVATARGDASATLTVTSAANGSASLTLSGVGVIPAQLTLADQAAVVFDTSLQPGPTPISSRLDLTNTGDEATGTISALISAGSSDFSVSLGTCTTPIAPRQYCSLDVLYTPSTSGPASATLHIASDPGGALDVPARAGGQAPAAIALVANDGTDFGVVPVNSSGTLSFAVVSNGDLPAGLLQNLTLGPDFTLGPQQSPYDCSPGTTDLNAGVSCTFQVVFSPRVPGAYGVTLGAASESGGSSSLPLTGTAQ
jgi:hypothetical protein